MIITQNNQVNVTMKSSAKQKTELKHFPNIENGKKTKRMMKRLDEEEK